AALSVAVLGIPQGVAYAMIAGLPPAMGLYAASVPAIVGSLFRSSRHAICGPTNALSLLVGTTGAAVSGLDPVPAALLLAFLVGLTQLAAGVLRLGVLVDYVSVPVVVGYISGAAVLIALGQLHHLTGTPAGTGHALERAYTWISNLDDANLISAGIGLGTAVTIVVVRRIDRRVPGVLLAIGVATLLEWALGLEDRGVRVVEDLSPIVAALPPITLPGRDFTFEAAPRLLPLAIAAAVLSLVESSASARATSKRTGQRLEMSSEFVGVGLANLTASLFSGYTCSTSLGRSALNQSAGARTRLSGVISGVVTLAAILLLGPVIDRTPLSALAGLLLVVAMDLFDVRRIKRILTARPSDAFAYALTVVATIALRLDYAVYLGVLTSLVLYLRRARMLSIHEVVFDAEDRVIEVPFGELEDRSRTCSRIRIIGIEGDVFFASAGELEAVLDRVIEEPTAKAIVLRLRRAKGLDVTALEILEAAAVRLAAAGRHLYVAGAAPEAIALLRRTGVHDVIGAEKVIPRELTFFHAAEQALAAALASLDDHPCEACPVERRLNARAVGVLRVYT
ncbi:MAG: SulP family inorganic anion transporter, partial [Sandaracinaceae bacterium]